MTPQINAVTIMVNDIKLMRNFYCNILGWPILSENKEVVILKLNNIALTLCTTGVFTEYTGIQSNGGPKEFYLTINLDSPGRVDESFKKLISDKVSITKMPTKTFWGGYSGFFADAEGNNWEVCYNPVANTKV